MDKFSLICGLNTGLDSAASSRGKKKKIQKNNKNNHPTVLHPQLTASLSRSRRTHRTYNLCVCVCVMLISSNRATVFRRVVLQTRGGHVLRSSRRGQFRSVADAVSRTCGREEQIFVPEKRYQFTILLRCWADASSPRAAATGRDSAAANDLYRGGAPA